MSSLEKVAVLASGGLDSAVLTADIAQSAQVHPIYVRCGLAWEHVEYQALTAFLKALNSANIMPAAELSVDVRAMYGDHWSVTGNNVPSATEPDEAVYLPGRNILLIAMASVWCATHDVSRIAVGSLGGNPFPDATPAFFEHLARSLSIGLNHEIHVEAPYRGLHKSDLIKRFSHMPLELTLTCMAPEGGQHCGRCNKCAERQTAFRDAEVPDRVDHPVDDRRCGRDGAGLTDALDAERIARRRVLEMHGLDGRQLHRGGHEIVHEGAGQELALLVVDHLLEQGATHTLRDAAVDLPLHDGRVDEPAAIVRDQIP
jgi:7-cyano-7-deazaguanine synthase